MRVMGSRPRQHSALARPRHKRLVLAALAEATQPLSLLRLVIACELSEEPLRLALKALYAEGEIERHRLDLPGGPYAYTLSGAARCDAQAAAEE